MRTNKSEYLVGEPIILQIDVKNVGLDTVAYGDGCDSDLEVSVKDLPTELDPHNHGCFSGIGIGHGSCTGTDHPPRVLPGGSVTMQRLIEHDLGPGAYTLHVEGRAPLGWWLFPDQLPQHTSGAPVEGNDVVDDLRIQVHQGTEDELEAAFAPYVAAAKKNDWDSEVAWKAITSKAPALLEGLIAEQAENQTKYRPFIEALGRIKTLSARNSLRSIFEMTDDPMKREVVLAELSHSPQPEEFDFFAHVALAADFQNANNARIDGGLSNDDWKMRTRADAMFAIGRLGGWRAVQVLARLRDERAGVEDDITQALSMTRSADAVPILIDQYKTSKDQRSVCDALATLTHWNWCAEGQKPSIEFWKKWWAENEHKTRIYSDNECEGLFDVPALK